MVLNNLVAYCHSQTKIRKTKGPNAEFCKTPNFTAHYFTACTVSLMLDTF